MSFFRYNYNISAYLESLTEHFLASLGWRVVVVLALVKERAPRLASSAIGTAVYPELAYTTHAGCLIERAMIVNVRRFHLYAS